MKKEILCAALALCSCTVFANEKPATAPKPEVATESKKDAKAFCYIADKVYSEGAELDGRICQRVHTADVFDQASAPLAWQLIPRGAGK